MTKRITHIAAALVMACGIGMIVWLAGVGTADIALADVSSLFSRVETLKFKMVFQWGADGEIESDMMYMQPGKTRMEIPEMITISDWKAGRFLTLDKQTKAAYAATVGDLQNPYTTNWLGEMESIIASPDAELIGARDMDGRRVRGWRVGTAGNGIAVWADERTAELVEVVFTNESGEAVMREFRYNVDIEAELFSLDPPESYRLESDTKMTVDEPALTDVATLLRPWASGSGGVFPERLDPAQFGLAAQKADWSFIRDKQHEDEVRATISRAFWYLMGQSKWTYAGAGVKLGDADTPVLWQHPDDDAESVNAIFGDCQIREIPVADLPKTE